LQKFFPFLSDKYKTGIVYEDGSFNDSRMIIAALLTATQGNQKKMPIEFKPANILNQAEFIDFIKN
jgi:glycerol-3-phosphate dehydrogenase